MIIEDGMNCEMSLILISIGPYETLKVCAES